MTNRADGCRLTTWLTHLAVVLLTWGGVNGKAVLAADGVRISDHLYSTRAVDATNMWAVGAFGTIFRTRDGAQSWRSQVSRTFEQLFSVDFVDQRHGWVVGRSGTILHTTDGGDSWGAQSASIDRHLFHVEAIDPQRAWIVGDWGCIISTGDAGKTWQDHSLTRDVILNGQSWPDPQHGWIVGEAGTIVATNDGGATWTDQTSGVEKTLFGVSFTDAQHGWAVGLDGLILRTIDSGQTWQVQHGDTTVSALEQVGFKEALENPSLYDVAVVEKFGYAVGDNGGIFMSTDGGESWQRKDMPIEAKMRWIRSVSLVPGTHGLLVGAAGLTVRIAADRLDMTDNVTKEEHAAQMAH